MQNTLDTNIRWKFSECYDFIESALQNHPSNQILVHSYSGDSRSAAIICAWLIERFKINLGSAKNIINESTDKQMKIKSAFEI